jgi:hypothetical protein
VGFYFEGLFERDIIVQSEFEFDGWFKNYNFLSFEVACMWPLLAHYDKYCEWVVGNLGYRAIAQTHGRPEQNRYLLFICFFLAIFSRPSFFCFILFLF